MMTTNNLRVMRRIVSEQRVGRELNFMNIRKRQIDLNYPRNRGVTWEMFSRISCVLAAIVMLSGMATAAEPFAPTRCEIIPLADHQVSFQVQGVEQLRWHHGSQYSRPFFYPLNGPSGKTLTRIGHPGAANHDHHRSVWFAHHDVNGFDFWSENGKTQIRQKLWHAYRDGDDEAIMANQLGWFDPEGNELMEQDIVTALIPQPNDEYLVEFQITSRPAKNVKSITLNKTNFGFLAIRVAKTISAFFGGGTISSSEGWAGEAEIFGKASRWVDYSGPVVFGHGPNRRTAIEGITCFDHPGNANNPAKWHVREDGWMGASVCRDQSHVVTHEKPLVLRYLLHVHSDPYVQARAETIHSAFAKRQGFEIEQRKRKHRHYEVRRTGAEQE